MIQTEKMMLEEIMRLLKDLENATYGETKNNGLDFPPNSSKFYYGAKKLYEIVDELIERFDPKYVTDTDYKFICESQKDTLLQLAVLKDNKKLKGMEVTWELENYLTKIQGLFSCISTYCTHQGENCGNVRVGGRGSQTKHYVINKAHETTNQHRRTARREGGGKRPH